MKFWKNVLKKFLKWEFAIYCIVAFLSWELNPTKMLGGNIVLIRLISVIVFLWVCILQLVEDNKQDEYEDY